MSSSNTMESLMGNLEEIAKQAPDLISELLVERDAIDAKIRQLRGVVRVLNPTQTTTTTTTTPKSTRAPNGEGPRRVISPGKALEIARVVLEVAKTQETFTVLEIHEQMGTPYSEPHLYQAFAHLRRLEFVGKVGKDPISKREQYKILDADALTQLEAVNATP